MTDEVWRRDEIESPCQKICVIHPAGDFCMGCYRTRDEIAGWSRMTAEARADIMRVLPEREATAPKPPRRGRAARRKAW